VSLPKPRAAGEGQKDSDWSKGLTKLTKTDNPDREVKKERGFSFKELRAT